MGKADTCSVDGCPRPVMARGWCGRHYGRWRRNGSPVAGRIDHGTREAFYREVVLPFEGDECLVWPYTLSDSGYGRISVNGAERMVSRRVCEDRHGPPPTPQHHAAHSCGNGAGGCVNPLHLRWATPKENCADAALHGTRARGQRTGGAKITDDQAREILGMRGGNRSQRNIACEYGVNQSTVSDIWTGKIRSWLGDTQ